MYKDIFKAMGFEDTEDIARNTSCYATGAKEEDKPARVEPKHHETVQISDSRYEAMSFDGPV